MSSGENRNSISSKYKGYREIIIFSYLYFKGKKLVTLSLEREKWQTNFATRFLV